MWNRREYYDKTCRKYPNPLELKLNQSWENRKNTLSREPGKKLERWIRQVGEDQGYQKLADWANEVKWWR